MNKVFKGAKFPDDPKIQDLTNIYRIKFLKEIDVLKVVKEYEGDPNVAYAEPNYIRYAQVTPNDPEYGRQWHLPKIQADSGWEYEKGKPSVVIAVIDTGVDLDHQDLKGNIWINEDETPDNGKDDDNNGYIDDIYGWDFVDQPDIGAPLGEYPAADGEDYKDQDNNPGPEKGQTPDNFSSHGTHCAGIASAVTNNGKGVSGLTWYCKIMALRAGYMRKDKGAALSDSDTSEAIVYAADNGAQVISMSWGDTTYSETIWEAVNYAYEKGCVLVGASGNDGIDEKQYPASYQNVIAVAATDSNDKKAYFSNYGNWIDVCAPGVDIYSTSFDDTYGTMNGTSMSTPLVAGLSALVISQHPDWSNDRTKRQILDYSDPIDSLNPYKYRGKLGCGRINVYRTLTSETPPPPLEPKLTNVFSYPNPTYDGRTTIRFDLKGIPTKDINICIYDSAGELVHRVDPERIATKGYTYLYSWNGENDLGEKVRSGIYLYKIEVTLNNKKEVVVGKIAVVK
ncbi:MAG: S8 family serine peptidase [bacterium]|nr:S8 family serine peptidase [bacterium]